jgi:hypothetical protein
MLSREEELSMLKEFIEKNGVTKLPPDERLTMRTSDVWKKSSAKFKKKKGRPRGK